MMRALRRSACWTMGWVSTIIGSRRSRQCSVIEDSSSRATWRPTAGPAPPPARALSDLRVEPAVEGEDEVRTWGDPQPGRGDPEPLQRLDLLEERHRVHDHAGTDETVHPGMADPGGHQVQSQHPVLAHDRVARVVAAIVTDDHVGVGGEGIDHLALPLVPPVSADDCRDRHDVSLLNG